MLAPRKRPLHTIIPAFMEKGDVKIGFGIMGGFNQAQAHAQFVSDIADFGLDMQQALEVGRFTKGSFQRLRRRASRRSFPSRCATSSSALGHQVRTGAAAIGHVRLRPGGDERRHRRALRADPSRGTTAPRFPRRRRCSSRSEVQPVRRVSQVRLERPVFTPADRASRAGHCRSRVSRRRSPTHQSIPRACAPRAPFATSRLPRTPERIARGKYLSEGLLQCFICHSERDWTKPGAPPIPALKGAGLVWPGRPWLVAPNLTPDQETGIGRWTDDMLLRAIREGISHDGRPLHSQMWSYAFHPSRMRTPRPWSRTCDRCRRSVTRSRARRSRPTPGVT